MIKYKNKIFWLGFRQFAKTKYKILEKVRVAQERTVAVMSTILLMSQTYVENRASELTLHLYNDMQGISILS